MIVDNNILVSVTKKDIDINGTFIIPNNIIKIGSSAFDQIVSTIREIATGIENFSASTNTVNTATDRLKNAADKLENLHKEVVKN